MSDRYVYAVRKNEDTGNIEECYVHRKTDRYFLSKELAKSYVATQSSVLDKMSIIFGLMLKNTYCTMVFSPSKGKFEEGAKIHHYREGFIRTDGNDTEGDNLENIMEI